MPEALHVGLDYRPAILGRSGIGRSVRELSRALRSCSGIALELFAHGFTAPLTGELEAARAIHGKHLHRSRLPGKSLPTLARLGWDATRLTGLGTTRRAKLFHWTDYVYPPVQADVVVTMTVHDVAFADSAKWHGDASSSRLSSRFAKALGRARAISCPSRATATMLRQHYPGCPQPTVIPFGVDHAHVSAAERLRGRTLARSLLDTDEPYVVMLGTLEPRKNHGAALDAMARLAASGRRVPLLVIGAAGWETTELERRLASERSFPCRWLRDLHDRDVLALLAASSLLLYPSSLEGFGFPPLEALELGVPAIIGNCEALVEGCGDAAIAVDGSDAAAIADAVARVLATPDVGARLVERWRVRRDRFTWSQCARAHERFWHETIAATVRGDRS